jgi:cytochrome c-type biogenesis protein CcmH/NrfG
MGVLSFIVTLPLAPVRGVISLAEVIQRQVEEELHNPASARRALEELEQARAAGEISEEEEEQAQQVILDRMTGSGPTITPEKE